MTAIYEAVRHITEAGAPHSPIEILISTGEELYCKGANAFDYSQVQAKEAYVLDLSGAIGAAAYAAPTLVSFKAEIQGKAAHAGFHPEDGINSIQAAARAVAQLPQGTWQRAPQPTSEKSAAVPAPISFRRAALSKAKSAA